MNRRWLAAAAVVLILALGFVWLRSKGSSTEAREEITAAKLRMSLLEGRPGDAGIQIPDTTNGVWAAIADIGEPNGTTTVGAFFNGGACMYWGQRGGIVAGQAHDGVRQAGLQAVAAMEGCASGWKPTGVHPPPRPGNLRLYAQTRAGLVSSEEVPVPAATMDNGGLAPCALAMNGVMNELLRLRQGAAASTPRAP